MNGISKETFEKADGRTRMDILFDYQKNTYNQIKEIKEILRQHPLNCDERFKRVEKKIPLNTAIAASSGFIGGAAVILAKLKFWG